MTSTNWNYKVHEVKPKSMFSTLDSETLEAELNRLGNQGWELVAIRSAEASSKLKLIMKRPR